MKTTEEFLLFQKTHLSEQMKKLEAIRLKGLSYIKLQYYIGVFGFFGFFVFVLLISGLYAWLIIVFSVLYFITYVYGISHYSYKLRKLNFTRKFKFDLLAPTIKFISQDLFYHPLRCVPSRNFLASKIFRDRISKYSGNDFVEGKIDKTSFHFSELFVTNSTLVGRNGSTDGNVVFQGLFFIADFHKDFQGQTLLVPRKYAEWNLLKNKLFRRKNHVVHLESQQLNKNFVCLSTNDVTARYILTYKIQNAIVEFKKNYPKDDIYFSFVHNHVFVAISNDDDLFTPSFRESVYADTSLTHYFEEIKLVVSLVEELNLNTRIWTRN